MPELSVGEVDPSTTREPVYSKFGDCLSVPPFPIVCQKCGHTSCVRREPHVVVWENPNVPTPPDQDSKVLMTGWSIPADVKCQRCGEPI